MSTADPMNIDPANTNPANTNSMNTNPMNTGTPESPADATPRRALGRGLDALLGETNAAGPFQHTPLESIVPNPYQPRQVFDLDDLRELAASIRDAGVLQPILIRPTPQPGRYELIAGERRWRAAAIAGLTTIPAIVRDAAPSEALALALVENLQRRDLNPMEAAQAYQRLASEFRFTQAQLATRVGKDRSTVTNLLRLLNLPAEVREQVRDGRITTGHAKLLLGLSRPDLQVNLARDVVSQQLSVRALEARIERLSQRSDPLTGQPVKARKSPHIRALEERLTSAVGSRVVVNDGKRSGRIELRYRNADERARLVARLLDTT